jgi:hypothetical protein
MAYQGFITDQGHFVTQTWVNEANAPHASIPPAGHDPLIGQNAAGRFIRVPVDDDVSHDQQLALPQDPWVLMTGGGYFFTPSISALAGPLSEAREELPVAAAQPRSPFAPRAFASTTRWCLRRLRRNHPRREPGRRARKKPVKGRQGHIIAEHGKRGPRGNTSTRTRK